MSLSAEHGDVSVGGGSGLARRCQSEGENGCRGRYGAPCLEGMLKAICAGEGDDRGGGGRRLSAAPCASSLLRETGIPIESAEEQGEGRCWG